MPLEQIPDLGYHKYQARLHEPTFMDDNQLIGKVMSKWAGVFITSFSGRITLTKLQRL